MHASPLAAEFRPITQDELENLPYLSLYVFYDNESKLYSQRLELVVLKSLIKSSHLFCGKSYFWWYSKKPWN